jgi:hypothetical protein
MSQTTIISCDRCGQHPLARERTETLSLSPGLAKRIEGLPDGHHMLDLCSPCQLDFGRFMGRALSELAPRKG